jgi:hypothetical protein
MVAMQLVATSVVGFVASALAQRAPHILPNPKADAAVKALVGAALVLASVWVKNGTGKGALIGAGIGIAHGAIAPLYPVLG